MSGWTRCCTSWLSWDVIYIYICYPRSQNPCFALFSEGCLKQPWECACKSSKQKADVFFESCMQEHWGCACKSSKQKADACCSFTFTLSLEVYDEQNWVCARIRTSQETMNLVTIEDNMKHHWIFCYTWQEILFQEFISEQGHNGWVWERQLTVVSIDIFWF